MHLTLFAFQCTQDYLGMLKDFWEICAGGMPMQNDLTYYITGMANWGLNGGRSRTWHYWDGHQT